MLGMAGDISGEEDNVWATAGDVYFQAYECYPTDDVQSLRTLPRLSHHALADINTCQAISKL